MADETKLERLETKIDSLKDSIGALSTEVALLTKSSEGITSLQVAMHEVSKRVDALEKWKVWLIGAAAGVGFISGGGASHLVHQLETPDQTQQHAERR